MSITHGIMSNILIFDMSTYHAFAFIIFDSLTKRIKAENWQFQKAGRYLSLNARAGRKAATAAVTLCRREMPERPIRLSEIRFKENFEIYLFIP